MISSIRGRVSYITENKVELDVGGVGFEVNVPASLVPELPAKGSEITLYTHLSVKEDDMSLFGFPTRDALQVFRLLIGISGVGPKGALGILSEVSPDELRIAVLSSDVKRLSKAPGIGKKIAERIVMELKDKFSREDEVRFMDHEIQGAALDAADPRQDTVLALMELGFPSSDAYIAVRDLDPQGKDAGELLKQALKNLGR